MSRTRDGSSILQWGALALGVVLLGGTLWYIDLTSWVQAARSLGFALPAALFVSGLWHVARTVAWAVCFPAGRSVSFAHLARVRLAAEAFSYLTLRGIAGEPLKVVLLTDRMDAREATAAVALERLAYMIGTTTIVGIGSVIAILALPLTRLWFRVFRAFAIGAAVVAVFTAIVISGRGTYVNGLFKRLDRWFGTSINGRRRSSLTSIPVAGSATARAIQNVIMAPYAPASRRPADSAARRGRRRRPAARCCGSGSPHRR